MTLREPIIRMLFSSTGNSSPNPHASRRGPLLYYAIGLPAPRLCEADRSGPSIPRKTRRRR